MVNDFKRELSKLTGIDFFNPKYREVFKKYFDDEKDGSDAEEERLVKMGITNEDGDVINKDGEVIAEDDSKNTDTEVKDDVENKVEDVDKAEDEREVNKIEETKADTEKKADEKAEDVKAESNEIAKDVDELKEDKTDTTDAKDEELLNTKIELALVRGGVKDEKLPTAIKYAKTEIGSEEELGKINAILREFPEWTKSYAPKSFGMSVDEKGDGLTEEEKRLKQMGIDPRD